MSRALRDVAPAPQGPDPVPGIAAEPWHEGLARRASRSRAARRAALTTRRIHIVGGPGSGKTSLATQLAARTGLPVHHLDDVARVGGGDGPLRSEEERNLLVEAILGQDGWITEGVHLLWTEPFLERADVIVWLDYISWSRATGRIVRRFFSGALREMRSRRGITRFTRFRDYGHQLRTLGSAIVEARHYYGPPQKHADAPAPGGTDDATSGSWSATAAQLAPFEAKLVHCRSAAEVTAFTQDLR